MTGSCLNSQVLTLRMNDMTSDCFFFQSSSKYLYAPIQKSFKFCFYLALFSHLNPLKAHFKNSPSYSLVLVHNPTWLISRIPPHIPTLSLILPSPFCYFYLQINSHHDPSLCYGLQHSRANRHRGRRNHYAAQRMPLRSGHPADLLRVPLHAHARRRRVGLRHGAQPVRKSRDRQQLLRPEVPANDRKPQRRQVRDCRRVTLRCIYYGLIFSWHSAAITDKNELYLWGLGEDGQLGSGNQESMCSPQLVAQNCRGAALGGFHTIYWDDKSCYSCGRNTFGQLGIGSKKSQNLMVKLAIQPGEQAVCGENHSLWLKDGKVYGCGDNTSYQLGKSEKKFWVSIEQVVLESAMRQICTGRKCSGGVTAKGEFLIWGQLMGEMRYSNKRVHANTKRVCLVGDSCIFETDNGDIYSFGKNISGELGQGDLENKSDPVMILKNIDVSQISLGENHSFILCRGNCKEEVSEQSFCDMMCSSLFKEDSFFNSSRNKENVKVQSHQSSAMQQLIKDKKIADLQLKLSQKDQIILKLQQRVQQLEKELQHHH